MEGFSIACTTCRARLKVRDARVLGQILPCPKCGSMVLIERPSRQAAAAEEDRVVDDLPTPAPRLSPPRSDSFENIDRLLEEPLRLPAGSASNRWRRARSRRDTWSWGRG